MARIRENSAEKILSIRRFLGINEEYAALKTGEGALCENFRVTDGGALQKRPGTRSAVLLTQSWRAVVTDRTGLVRAWGSPSRDLRLYPRVLATDYDTVVPDGEPIMADYETCAGHTGWYFDTAISRIDGSETRVPLSMLTGLSVIGRSKLETAEARYAGQARADWSGDMADYVYAWFIQYESLTWTGRRYAGVDPEIVSCESFSAFDGTKFTPLDADSRPVCFFRKASEAPTEEEFLQAAGRTGKIGKLKLNRSHNNYVSTTDTPLWSLWLKNEIWQEAQYYWNFRIVGVEPASESDTEVKALWSGFVAGEEAVVAACNGSLWALEEAEGDSFTRTLLGSADTAGSVALFGFEDKLYVLAGTQYRVWDGGAVTDVAPYPSYDPQSEDPPDFITDGSAAKMRCAEVFSSSKGARVFLCGDGTNRVLYSGFDSEGKPRADSFPAGNVLYIGDANTPVTALVRHYDRLLCFKTDSAWVISADGNSFSVSPMNRGVGCEAVGQAVIVDNRPRTPDGGGIMEWTNAALTGSYRNAKSVSERVRKTLASLDTGELITFYDKYSCEYYAVAPDGRALVHNTAADAWYLYTGFFARCMLSLRGLILLGGSDGRVRVLSRRFSDDDGAAIDCRWESGAEDLGCEYRLKHTLGLWLTLAPSEAGACEVSLVTNGGETEPKTVQSGSGPLPRTRYVRMKTGKSERVRLVIASSGAEAATVLSAELRAIKGGRAK